MKDALSDFVADDRLDRTTFSDGERAAADYLKEKVDGLGLETTLQPFEYTATVGRSSETFFSQNVVALKKCGKENAKTVIVGANYDNQTSDVKVGEYKLLEGMSGHGAYMNGTGVATLLSLAEKLSEKSLDVDVYFVFFGAGEVYNRGAEEFAEKYLTASLLPRVTLMFNLQHIGGDNLYVYCDEVPTEHEDYITKKAAQAQIDLSKVPATQPRMDVEYISGIAYTHIGMLGANKPFFERKIPTANIFGGTLDTFGFALDECKGKSNIAYTKNDTIAEMDARMDGYADKMAQTAELVYGCLNSPDFISCVENSYAEKSDYSLLMKEWIPYVIVLSAMLVFGLALIPFAYRFEKKYPYKKTVRKLKVAVFGMDYEDKNSGDVFLDVKTSDKRDPFDGY